jgi:hypothetical protein
MVIVQDYYCAICGSCAHVFQVGSKSEKAQRVRSKVLRNRRRRRSEPEEHVFEPDNDDSDGYDDEHSRRLKASYDPQILEGHDASWVPELLLVANDPRKRRAPRTFLCGMARLEHGGFALCRGTKTMNAKSCTFRALTVSTMARVRALETFLATSLV